MHLFVRILEADVRDACAMNLKTGLPHRSLGELTQHAMVTMVLNVSFLAFAEKREPGELSPSRAKGSHKRRAVVSPSRSGAEPAKSRNVYCTGVCPELVAQRRESNECVKCGKTGHRFQDCKAKEPVIPTEWRDHNEAWLRMYQDRDCSCRCGIFCHPRSAAMCLAIASGSSSLSSLVHWHRSKRCSSYIVCSTIWHACTSPLCWHQLWFCACRAMGHLG